MKKKILMGLLLITFSLIFIQCNKSSSTSNSVACTMEFRTVTIKITGDTLDRFYTIRVNTGDTIRLNTGGTFGQNTYPVLDDSYQSSLANHTEQFRFVGIKNNNILVQEVFSIKADQCHISYVSGNQIVNL